MRHILNMGLDDELLSALAHTSPTMIQLYLLRTPGSVRRFVGFPSPPAASADHHPVETLARWCGGTPPVYTLFQNENRTFGAQCTVGDNITQGTGQSKRRARAAAATSMLALLHTPPPAGVVTSKT